MRMSSRRGEGSPIQRIEAIVESQVSIQGKWATSPVYSTPLSICRPTFGLVLVGPESKSGTEKIPQMLPTMVVPGPIHAT